MTYPGLRSIAARLRLGFVDLPTDRAGILPDALEDAVRTHRPKALYLNPTRRMEIAEVLWRHGLTLVEDDAYGFVPESPPAPVVILAPDLTWHIGGLAKCIGAGLRVAYSVAPDIRAAHLLAQILMANTLSEQAWLG